MLIAAVLSRRERSAVGCPAVLVGAKGPAVAKALQPVVGVVRRPGGRAGGQGYGGRPQDHGIVPDTVVQIEPPQLGRAAGRDLQLTPAVVQSHAAHRHGPIQAPAAGRGEVDPVEYLVLHYVSDRIVVCSGGTVLACLGYGVAEKRGT